MPRQTTNWTLPNVLTLLRICLTPAFVVAFLGGKITLAWQLFLLAGLSDGVDGFLARVLDQRSEVGAVIDPLADKILLVTSFTLLGVAGLLPVWAVVLVIGRDALIVGGLLLLRLRSVNLFKAVRPTWTSKVNTALQLGLVFCVLTEAAFGTTLGPAVRMLVPVVALLTVVSGAQYVFTGRRLLRESEG